MVNERSQHACCPSLDEQRGAQAEIILPVSDQMWEFFIECDSSQHLPRILVDLSDFGRNLADIVLALKVHRSRRLLRASVKARQGSFRASPTCFNNLFYSIRALTGAHCSRLCIPSVHHTELQHTKVWIQGWSPRSPGGNNQVGALKFDPFGPKLAMRARSHDGVRKTNRLGPLHFEAALVIIKSR